MNTLEVKNSTLIELSKKYGTPLYIYNADKIALQYNTLLKVFSNIEKLKINYACKANTNLNILKFLKKLGSGLDAVSIQEIEIGLKAGFDPNEILYTPNGVSFSEINKSINLGVKINIDNCSTLEFIGFNNINYPIGIRINPHIMAGENYKISVGHIDSKFGISYYQIPYIKKIIDNTGINVNGIHMHTGSDILDINLFLRGIDILLEVAQKFMNIDYIDVGSGFKVPYKKEDKKTNINIVSSIITKKFNSFCKKIGKKPTLIFEPGKFLVSESGYFLVSVNVIKHTISTVFAEVDSGFNHLIRPMYYNAYHDIQNISNPLGRLRLYTVVGYICESDTFGLNRQINEIREGDILCIKNSGAYCFSMSSNYNSRYRPSEVLIYKGNDFLIRKRETLQDLIQNIVEIDF
ncbi:MAG: diaminopimelate decarboxylase [Candidatus Bostrichicola ureolyticus]|nr:MAG: diaminopimelate decarboxylase [Candidatus Bostrichicola ureolyticus]